MSGPHASLIKNPRVMGRWVWGLDRQPNLSAHGVGHPFGIVREVRHPIPINQKLSSSICVGLAWLFVLKCGSCSLS